jgi:DegV family protein with EDD domain
MANVLVMTDTVACLPNTIAEENHVKIVPTANITYGGQTYVENVTLTATQAYEIIKKDPDHFMTSAVTPGLLLDAFREAGKSHKQIFFITISSKLSAVSQSGKLAAESLHKDLPEVEIRIFDSKTCAGAEGLIALAAAKAAAKGKTLDQLASFAEAVRQKTGGFIYLDTLRYTYRTGRMSKSASRIASILNIKPISQMSNEGTMELVDKVRKRSDGFVKLIELVKKTAKTDALHFMVSHADAPEAARIFSEQLRQEFKCLSMIISDYSPVMGYSTGPGALFVGFHPELDL